MCFSFHTIWAAGRFVAYIRGTKCHFIIAVWKLRPLQATNCHQLLITFSCLCIFILLATFSFLSSPHVPTPQPQGTNPRSLPLFILVPTPAVSMAAVPIHWLTKCADATDLVAANYRPSLCASYSLPLRGWW